MTGRPNSNSLPFFDLERVRPGVLRVRTYPKPSYTGAAEESRPVLERKYEHGKPVRGVILAAIEGVTARQRQATFSLVQILDKMKATYPDIDLHTVRTTLAAMTGNQRPYVQDIVRVRRGVYRLLPNPRQLRKP